MAWSACDWAVYWCRRVCVCELVKNLGVFFFFFFAKWSRWVDCWSRCNNLPSVVYSLWGPGKERELNIYPLHVKMILKIANRCRTAVCGTYLREGGVVAERVPVCVWEREIERERVRMWLLGKKLTIVLFWYKTFTPLGTYSLSARACVRGHIGVIEWGACQWQDILTALRERVALPVEE